MDKASKELLRQALDRVQTALDTARAILNGSEPASSNPSVSPQKSAPSVSAKTEKEKPRRISTAESLPAASLGPITVGADWPQAVQPHTIVNQQSAVEKQFRGLQIARLLGDFKGQTVLDLGCGDGCIAREIAHQAKKVVAYDLRRDTLWENLIPENLAFTIDRGPVDDNQYDTIVLHDVLDHLEGDDPVKFMGWVHSILAPGGKVLVRTHPWTAKHGGHLYERGHNKAFLHLAMTADEMAKAGIEPVPNLRLNRPMAAYEHIFAEAGLKVALKKGHSEPVEEFFSGPIIDRIVKVTWKGAIDKEGALKIMANSFIDYTLTAA